MIGLCEFLSVGTYLRSGYHGQALAETASLPSAEPLDLYADRSLSKCKCRNYCLLSLGRQKIF